MSGFKLKLKVPGSHPDAPRAPSVVSTGTPSTPAPLSAITPGGSKVAPKLKFKTSNSQPPTPVSVQVEDVKPKKTKAGRATKPSAKLIESKKRIKEESESENEGSTIAVAAPERRPSKKIKLVSHLGQSITQATGPKTPVVIKAKVKGKLPARKFGEGYDSEASDREEDPYIEEEFVLRMMPGEDCDYLRTAIAEKKIGLPKNQGGADVYMKFHHNDGRRASITIRGHCYAATLVDLPCVIEAMKSWDRRGWLKSADICQMLWVFASVKKEDDARTIPLPKIIDEDSFQYPHGLTPPMHFARKRRFRKRVSRTAIEKVESAVEALLKADAEAVSTRFEMIEPDKGDQASTPGDGDSHGEYSEDVDAEGEVDPDTPGSGYFGAQHAHEAPPIPFNENAEADLDDIEDMWEAEMEGDAVAAATPSSAIGVAPSMLNGGDTAMIEGAIEEEEDDSDDESLEDDDGDDENTVAEDQGEKARLAHIQSVKEDIADMEKQIEDGNRKIAATQNIILRRRLEDNIRRMKAELQLKISSLGEDDGDD
jgi:transcription initiation factor TFIID subunit 7